MSGHEQETLDETWGEMTLRRCEQCGEQPVRLSASAYCTRCWLLRRSGQFARRRESQKRSATCYRCNGTKLPGDSSCKSCAKALRLQRFGMTCAQYDALLAEQSYRCDGCGISVWEYRIKAGKDFAIDHDHRCCPKIGKSCGNCVRALYCNNCNAVRGMAHDDAEALRRLADSVERTNALMEFRRAGGRDWFLRMADEAAA